MRDLNKALTEGSDLGRGGFCVAWQTHLLGFLVSMLGLPTAVSGGVLPCPHHSELAQKTCRSVLCRLFASVPRC